MRFIRSAPVIEAALKTAVGYDAPSNLSYFWSFGVFSICTLAIQFITGIFLSMHYIPELIMHLYLLNIL